MKSRETAKSAASLKRVLVVDDHPVIRQGIGVLLDHREGLTMCGEAEDAQSALAEISKREPDLAIVDVALKRSNGLDLVRDIKTRFPTVPVLVLSMHDESLYAERAMRRGARGYIMKQEPPELLIEAIQRVLSGKFYLSERMSNLFLEQFIHGSGEPEPGGVYRLTDRELEVYRLLGQGRTSRQIANQLSVSIKTIDSHREGIKEKLGLTSATELVQNAVLWTNSQSTM